MEYDLADEMMAAEWFVTKVRDSRIYAQNLYAALCNMQWEKITPWREGAGDLADLDRGELWSCSWRSSGGIVAEIRGGDEDYMDWYCSGIGGGMSVDDTLTEGHVPEGYVTDEIAYDLNVLGWAPVPWPKDDVNSL